MILFMLMALAALAPGEDGAKPAERARANLGSYFSTDDYPATAASRGIEGTVRFTLEVSPDGRVSTCTVTSSSGDAALDAATCSVLLSRAEYLPARDAEGNAIGGTDQGSVTWRLPPPEAEPFGTVRAPVRIDIIFGADADGKAVCSTFLNGGAAGEDGERLCASLLESRAADSSETMPANMAITIDVAISFEDDEPPRPDLDRGRLLVDATAQLTIDAQGRVSNCRIVETNAHEEGGLAILPDLCRFPALETPMFPQAPAGSQPRRGIVRAEVHLRLGAPNVS